MKIQKVSRETNINLSCRVHERNSSTRRILLFIFAAGLILLIALYDLQPDSQAATSLPGWRQANTDGFGDAIHGGLPSLAVFEDHLYAGTGTWTRTIPPRPTEVPFQIWRTGDGSNWQQAGVLWGKGAAHLIAFDGHLYVGSEFWPFGDRCVWRSPDGVTWTPVITDGFGYGNSGTARFAVFNDTLYASTWNETTGTEIWRTSDGVRWTQFGSDGLGDASNRAAIASEVFDSLLYFGIGNWDTGAQLWQTDGITWTCVITGGFSNADNVTVSSLAAFNDHLYAGLRNESGIQVWRSQDGAQWDQVASGGFGNPETNGENALEVFKDQLYLVVGNYTTGLEVWRTVDGIHWEQIGFAGFDDGGNERSNWDNATTTFRESLYIGVDNWDTGGEIWQMLYHQVFLPLVEKESKATGNSGKSIEQ